MIYVSTQNNLISKLKKINNIINKKYSIKRFYFLFATIKKKLLQKIFFKKKYNFLFITKKLMAL